MKTLFVVVGSLFVFGHGFSQNKYAYKADIAHIQDDKVAIELTAPAIKEEEIIFSFPKVIPGSYSEKNFGKYIEDFTAKDEAGKKLKTKRLNPNQYVISRANKLKTINYLVNDTWDKADKDFIFQPGGTNIEAGSNVVMNNHAFYGYFEGYKNLPIEIAVNKPASMFASTHLEVVHSNAENDLLKAPDYFYLADNPVFYSVPDTSSFLAGNTTINVSVISVTGKVKSKQVAEYLKPMAQALNLFFNGLPVKSYQFLFYFEDVANLGDKRKGGGIGALEHNYSSLYFLPELSFEPRLKSIVQEVSSHEFLHILTPLNLHSEEIEQFDYINPKMSKHLWLYEGVTEYFAQLTQVQNGLLTGKAFFSNMRDKINEAAKYGDFSMTEMSERVLEDKYQAKYGSVYNRGALIALMLDIFIREQTAGEKDLKSVIMQLTKEYGAGKPFKDDQLFEKLIAASHPSVKGFIEHYIVGSSPLPYQEMLAKIAYDFSPTKRIEAFSSGKMGLRYDPESKGFAFSEVEKKNSLEIENDDLLVSVNGVEVNDNNLDSVWESYFGHNVDYPELNVVVIRKGEKKELSGPLFKGYMEAKNYLEPLINASEEQKKRLKELLKS